MSTSIHLSRFRKWLLASPPIEFAIGQLRNLLVGAIRQGPVPQHVAFVMDGNRRFARTHGIETVEGHNLGFEALARILEVCYKSGVKVVTIYAFSIENFKRSKFEVDALMELARVQLSQMVQHGEILDRYGAKVRVLGRLDLLRPDVLAAVNRAMEVTSGNGNCILNICFPYTSRDEITTAVRETVAEYSQPLPSSRPSTTSSRSPFSESHIAQNIRAQAQVGKGEDVPSDTETASESSAEGGAPKHDLPNGVYENGSSFSSSSTLHLAGQPDTPNGKAPVSEPTPGKESPVFMSPETITRQTLSDHLFTYDNPPLDLLVRTSGVERLSDFMLWQCHEDTEIVFLDILWPDFDLWHFMPVLLGWQRRISKSKKNPDAEGNFDGDISDSVEESNGKVKEL
ncbi:undecaprenyl diphosphate synthase family protein [Aspergillus ibericus CBS 121593]|uniref:Alkyl transferase n=1 Tax=Aspergillus ibericus CBS 121593 TaxID=1448316 RepID=A0A395GQH8_9EURO|nr:Di-trans-poly-cis-decaprenylcistransferase [Aspergillus ibericus CBS 121593]RAK97612.1 Di-trans-poly-cis-decaprenylcistransferase [Aspergillus ibericus CBS 121593]